jgi:hypothetical protein
LFGGRAAEAVLLAFKQSQSSATRIDPLRESPDQKTVRLSDAHLAADVIAA